MWVIKQPQLLCYIFRWRNPNDDFWLWKCDYFKQFILSDHTCFFSLDGFGGYLLNIKRIPLYGIDGGVTVTLVVIGASILLKAYLYYKIITSTLVEYVKP